MYDKILLCVDNSEHSGYAVSLTAVMARTFGSSVVAAHVYAARLHDRRFADLEPGLPKEYQDPKRLEASRKTHGSLIGKGLHMISDSYLEAARAELDGIYVEVKSIEGKNYVELSRESAAGYNLAVIGARGLGLASVKGRCATEALGGVCARFLRRTRTDVLVARTPRPIEGTILVAVDGSPESYEALRRSLKLAKVLGACVEVVTCFDPDYHPAAFKSIAHVLSEENAKVFRFKEQENLHDRIINHGLENLYQGYLENARVLAQGRGQQIETRLLTGRPGLEIAARVGEFQPSLVVVGRFGLHRTDDSDIGNTAETVVRLAETHVLVVNSKPDVEPLAWTKEAEEKVNHVPEFMRPMVKKAVELHARARGLTEVTEEVVSAAKTSHGVPLPGHGS